MLLQPWLGFVNEHRLHLPRRAGKHDVVFTLMSKSKTNSQSDFIRQRCCTFDNNCLLAVVLSHYNFAVIEKSLHMVHRKLVDMNRTSQCCSQRVFGKIIFGRADSAGEQNNIRTALGNFYGLLNTAAVVPNHRLKIDVNSHRGQLYR
ncbi:hypothetical protein D3C81_1203700 [compost metagenome]